MRNYRNILKPNNVTSWGMGKSQVLLTSELINLSKPLINKEHNFPIIATHNPINLVKQNYTVEVI